MPLMVPVNLPPVLVGRQARPWIAAWPGRGLPETE